MVSDTIIASPQGWKKNSQGRQPLVQIMIYFKP